MPISRPFPLDAQESHTILQVLSWQQFVAHQNSMCRDAELLAVHLREARAGIMASLSAASMESYSRAYPHLVQLHLLQVNTVDCSGQESGIVPQAAVLNTFMQPSHSRSCTQRLTGLDISFVFSPQSVTTACCCSASATKQVHALHARCSILSWTALQCSIVTKYLW